LARSQALAMKEIILAIDLGRSKSDACHCRKP